MTSLLLAAIAAPLALQAATAAPAPVDESPDTAAITTLDQLPIEQSAAPRCAIAFAVISRWQKAGDERGSPYADMEETGGREFFVRSLMALMEETGMGEDAVIALAFAEVDKLDTAAGAERVEAMMPACLLMKDAAGL